ncbi:MAG: cyclic pyranopterin monophosphate synthase MoaC [Planctomycetota bacterium]|nr:MAG: cyclic pyranopterin monophosphate synthase MoaC [Planctomycetota bacterium]
MSSDSGFSHLTPTGEARMVDVSPKSATLRTASASARVTLGARVYEKLTAGGVEKGDVFAAARIAGIQAAKRTSELIPLCHGLSPECVSVQFELEPPAGLLIRTEVRLTAKTGVEMEALVAASVAALTVYDMCKALSKGIEIGPIRLESKTGGKSGDWRRPESVEPVPE